MFGTVLAANAFGLRVSSGFQLVLASVLVVVIACAIAIALPSRGGDNWTPFAPHGWWAIGTSANILVWLFVGWEAVAQLAGDFRRPESDLPRSMALAFGIVTVLYCGLAAATVAVTAGTHSRVPLADLISVGFGRVGRDATAVLAVALTMGTMTNTATRWIGSRNCVEIGGVWIDETYEAKMLTVTVKAMSEAYFRILERHPGARDVFRIHPVSSLLAGISNTDDLVRGTSACFIGVYALALFSAARILDGHDRVLAAFTLALIVVLAAFSGWFLALPVAAAGAALALRRSLRPRAARRLRPALARSRRGR